jgi:hypothetical protein
MSETVIDDNEATPGALGHFAPSQAALLAGELGVEVASLRPVGLAAELWGPGGVLQGWVRHVDSNGWVRHVYDGAGTRSGWHESYQRFERSITAPWDPLEESSQPKLLGCTEVTLVRGRSEVDPPTLRVTLAPGCGVVLVEELVGPDAWCLRYRLTSDPRDVAAEASVQPGVTPTELEPDLGPQRLVDSSVAHPSHYTKGRVECIDAIESAVQGLDPVSAVLVGQVLKYLWRHAHKGTPVKDIEKAAWYLERLTRHVAAKEEDACKPSST